MEPLVIVDYSKYTPIAGVDYYSDKSMGRIFIIRSWWTDPPFVNNSVVYGEIDFTIHPTQKLEAFDFTNPNQPTVVTGIGSGWGKYTIGGSGTKSYLSGGVHGTSGDCSSEFTASFTLIGGLYPAPTCKLEVLITTTYSFEGQILLCKTETGIQVPIPLDNSLLMDFYEPKTLVTFLIPDGYVVQAAGSIGNQKYDLSYFLRKFTTPPSSAAEIAEATLVNIPYQYFDTGCQKVNLDFNSSFLPENVDSSDFVWDQMLTPESQRVTPSP
ncbi:MAG: hypothetical protein ACK2UB_05840 [Anaerolineales bacterium]